jgi:membrane protein YqaA with SNARE-associated domain
MHEILDNLVKWSISIMEEMGMLGLFIFSFTESLFHPIPVDPVIVAMAIIGTWSVYDIFFWALLGSVLGGLFAHFLGSHFGKKIFLKVFGENKFLKGKEFMEKWGVWSVLIVAVTPLPFKVIAWIAGVLHMNMFIFFITSLIGRAIRFALVLGGFQLLSSLFLK